VTRDVVARIEAAFQRPGVSRDWNHAGRLSHFPCVRSISTHQR